jgi:hypothetical protein
MPKRLKVGQIFFRHIRTLHLDKLTTGALEEVRSLTGRAPVLPKKRNRSEICQSKVLLREINAAMLTAEEKRFAS